MSTDQPPSDPKQYLVVARRYRPQSFEELVGQKHVAQALVNAIKHGNQYDTNKRVHVVCKISRSRVRIEITDEGNGFNLQCIPDPTEDENLEKPSGRGIMLMRNYMSLVQYNDVGNCVVMEKLRNADTS